MALRSVLVANRGEVALRIVRAAREFGLRTVAVYSEDDVGALHASRADRAVPLRGSGPAAYLDQAQLLEIATAEDCGAVHPGYGFLSENPEFAERCQRAGLVFVGPAPATLALLGDKVRARAFAQEQRVPVLPGTGQACTLDEAEGFMDAQGSTIVVKAVAGGGGRGMRVIHARAELRTAFEQCAREAAEAFGDGALYAERYVGWARHIEVQVMGDGTGAAVHAYERECSAQRRHQKIMEFAPSPGVRPELRESVCQSAVKLAAQAHYRGLCTMEFLVEGEAGEHFWFIEANPRLQVEHTVTEAVTGLDLVRIQLALAAGATLGELGLADQAQIPRPRGYAVQLRLNAERLGPAGRWLPTAGQLQRFELPSGPGVRVDTHCMAGVVVNPNFDSLLAKVVVHEGGTDFEALLRRAQGALADLRLTGVASNASLLAALLGQPEVRQGRMHTAYLDEQAERLAQAAQGIAAEWERRPDSAAGAGGPQAQAQAQQAQAGKSEPRIPEGCTAVRAPLLGSVVGITAQPGDTVRAEQALIVLSAMKMEHTVSAGCAGVVHSLHAAVGDTVAEGQLLLLVESRPDLDQSTQEQTVLDLDAIRPDLAEVLARHEFGRDDRRPAAVARRRKTGHRTARENLADLIDPGTFIEYGGLLLAAQRRRRSLEELIEKTPADGLVAGVGHVNRALFADDPTVRTRCVVMSYDYTVFAGTQGVNNHHKKDRMFELAERQRLPIVFFTEGGGGRPGDTDAMSISWLDCLAFLYFGKLSGLVPLIGIATGRCFAGNAALFGCCDVTIATEGTTLGMGGPAMIEGGGLGVFKPEEVGPIDVQEANGVVDVRVRDEAEAVAVAKKYLSYFQGPVSSFSCEDQRVLRSLIPENRLRVYDVRTVIETLCDSDSVLELRRGFGHGMVTALARVGGRPLGIIANNPMHLAGAIDREGADKAARFMQLCDGFDLPLLFLCDTPGIMVGPESEKTGMVRHAARMFVTAASLEVPFFTIVLRKGYGLGAQLMAGGSFRAPVFIVSWPTGEFGAMGLEGAVKLGFRKELEAIADPEEQRQAFENMVAAAYELGKGVNLAAMGEIDDVIDPADSRKHILAALESAPPPAARPGKKRPFIDTW